MAGQVEVFFFSLRAPKDRFVGMSDLSALLFSRGGRFSGRQIIALPCLLACCSLLLHSIRHGVNLRALLSATYLLPFDAS